MTQKLQLLKIPNTWPVEKVPSLFLSDFGPTLTTIFDRTQGGVEVNVSDVESHYQHIITPLVMVVLAKPFFCQ